MSVVTQTCMRVHIQHNVGILAAVLYSCSVWTVYVAHDACICKRMRVSIDKVYVYLSVVTSSWNSWHARTSASLVASPSALLSNGMSLRNLCATA
jgi:hypothetical protein